MAKKTIITIGRTTGSAGSVIGKKLAEKLGWNFYDKEILKDAAKQSGLCESILESLDEKPKSLLYSLVMDPYSVHAMMPSPYENLEQSANNAISEAIRQAAEKGNCVFVGRCADYILRDNENVLNIFVSAPEKDCIQRIMENHSFTEQEAKEYIKKTNKQRASYYNYYSNKKWGELQGYHLCADSSLLSIDEMVDWIIQMIQKSK